MALLLHRLGRWCAGHVKTVVAAWLIALVALGGAAATLGQPASSEVSIPDARFETVIDHLGRAIPEAAGGFGTVVIRSGEAPFTDAQQDAVREVFARWTALDHVIRVVDPFEGQAQLDAVPQQLAAAKALLDANGPQLDDAGERLEAGRNQLAFGRAALEQLEATNPADPGLPTLREQLAQGQAEYDAGLAQYEQGRAEYDAGLAQYEQGMAQVAAMNGMRMVSPDGRTAIVQVQFDTSTHSVPQSIRDAIPDLGEALAAAGVGADYSVEITQDQSLVGAGEILGLVVAGIVLVAMLGSLLAAGLPLVGALVGVGVGVAAAVALTVTYEMNSMTPALALMLGLAVGIDYSLFIINRHRGQLLGGMDLHASIARATGTSGNAVLFAGATVVIALVALLLSGIPLLAQMGLVAAGTVTVAVLIALTLVPALLAALGPRVISRRAWRTAGFGTPGDPATRVATRASQHGEEHGGWFVSLVTRRPLLTVLAVLAIVGLLAAPATDLRLGLTGGGNEPASSTAYRTYSTIAEEFGPGMNGPVLAMATLPGRPTPAEAAAAQSRLATALKGVHGVQSVVPFGMSADHTTLAFQVVPTSGPADAQTVETVHGLLGSIPAIERTSGATIGITGQTVANIEISERLAAALPGYLLVVVGLSLVILLGVFRSLVVPLVATAGFLLTIAAAFGATVAVYQWGWLGSVFGVHEPGPILSFLPIMLIGVLFGLAMDYQMFLVTGMREAWSHGEDARRAVRTGFVHGAKVVTAAAIIMFSVFGGFVFSHLTMVRPMGFALAVGVLVDAVLVRMTLTPAIMHLLGERAWALPARLDRWVPRVDVEGAALALPTVSAPDEDRDEDRDESRTHGPGGR